MPFQELLMSSVLRVARMLLLSNSPDMGTCFPRVILKSGLLFRLLFQNGHDDLD
jgi:hypothetical protein